jgi:hypothetical protein
MKLGSLHSSARPMASNSLPLSLGQGSRESGPGMRGGLRCSLSSLAAEHATFGPREGEFRFVVDQ